MRMLAIIRRPGTGDRAVLAAVIAALVVLAAVPAASDAETRRADRSAVCAAR